MNVSSFCAASALSVSFTMSYRSNTARVLWPSRRQLLDHRVAQFSHGRIVEGAPLIVLGGPGFQSHDTELTIYLGDSQRCTSLTPAASLSDRRTS